MFYKPTSALNVMVIAAVVLIFTGCSSAGKKPVGAHARAEKGMMDDGDRGGGDTNPWDTTTDRPTSTIPLVEFAASKGMDLCTRIHFDYDNSEVKSEFKMCLNNVAEFLKTYPDVNILIEGHCDERGTPEYNLALGERRALNTSMYLIEQGISTSRFTTRSMGEEKLMELCSNERCWKQNRRAEFYAVVN